MLPAYKRQYLAAGAGGLGAGMVAGFIYLALVPVPSEADPWDLDFPVLLSVLALGVLVAVLLRRRPIPSAIFAGVGVGFVAAYGLVLLVVFNTFSSS